MNSRWIQNFHPPTCPVGKRNNKLIFTLVISLASEYGQHLCVQVSGVFSPHPPPAGSNQSIMWLTGRPADGLHKLLDVTGERGGVFFSPRLKTSSGTLQERKERAEFSIKMKTLFLSLLMNRLKWLHMEILSLRNCFIPSLKMFY